MGSYGDSADRSGGQRPTRTHQNSPEPSPHQRPLPLWRDAQEYLEVDARHRAREHREILLVEEVVDGALECEVGPPKGKALLKGYVTHEVVGELARERYVVRRHGEALRVVAPLIGERPCAPCQTTRDCRGVLWHIG